MAVASSVSVVFLSTPGFALRRAGIDFCPAFQTGLRRKVETLEVISMILPLGTGMRETDTRFQIEKTCLFVSNLSKQFSIPLWASSLWEVASL